MTRAWVAVLTGAQQEVQQDGQHDGSDDAPHTPDGLDSNGHATWLATSIPRRQGSKLKILATGHSEPRKARSGEGLTPTRLVDAVVELAKGWEFDAVSLGYPGLVGESGPASEPGYLGPGWVGFDFTAAFGRPVRIVNDAAMQALGSYDGGRMLFLGLGTGLGAALVVPNVLITLELGLIPYGSRKLCEVLGRAGREKLGKTKWRRAVSKIAPALMSAFVADYVVLGGGSAKDMNPKDLPTGIRLGHNLTAFRGGFRLWNVDGAHAQSPDGGVPDVPQPHVEWKLL